MTRPLNSGLFIGQVTHHRRLPKEHRLAYSIYSLLLDLDELDTLHARLRWFSVDRFNLFSFHQKDRGAGSDRGLKAQVEMTMRAAGIEPDGGRITLLTMPRLLGWAFNPLSIFFCHGQDGDVRAILWEVDNTFGERHAYFLPAEPGPRGEIVQECGKAFHVSPFMDMKLSYRFKVKPTPDHLSIVIETFGDEGMVMTARHLAHRYELTDAALVRAFFTIPLLTARVVGGIHWEALKIWLKGIKLRRHPAPPVQPITFAHVAKPKDEVETHEPA